MADVEPAFTHLTVRVINKLHYSQELRVFVDRPDGTQDRIGTFNASRARIAMLRHILERGARILHVPYNFIEPVGTMLKRG